MLKIVLVFYLSNRCCSRAYLSNVEILIKIEAHSVTCVLSIEILVCKKIITFLRKKCVDFYYNFKEIFIRTMISSI